MTDERDEQVDMESLFNKELDEAKLAEEQQSLLPPKGNYTTNPDDYPLNVFYNVFKEKVDGAETGEERRMITFTGRVTTISEGKEVSAPLRLRMSPDHRLKMLYENDEPTGEFDTKPDSAYTTWLEATKLYKEKVKESPKTEQNVIEFLKSVPFRVYGYHGRNGEMGFKNITAVKRGR